MSFDSIADLLVMGGHGFYVWLCYAVSLAVVLANVLGVRGQRRRTLRELAGQRLRRQ